MDIVACVIDKTRKELQFSGAKNPLVLVQNGELQEVKGDIYGMNEYRKTGEVVQFTSHTFDISIPTTFYIYSDGYQDQFGGKEGKKFMKKRLRELLGEISTQPMPKQKQILEATLDNWMDGHEQIDDILVMGIEIS